MAYGIPDYEDAVKSKDDIVLEARIKRMARTLPVTCPCTTKAATEVILGTIVDYQLMTCKRCKVSTIWFMNKFNGMIFRPGTEEYNETINFLEREIHERNKQY